MGLNLMNKDKEQMSLTVTTKYKTFWTIVLPVLFLICGCQSIANQLSASSLNDRRKGRAAYNQLSQIEKNQVKQELEEIALNHPDATKRYLAIQHVNDVKVLGQIVLKDSNFTIREVALSKISDVSILKQVAQKDSQKKLRSNAVSKIKDEQVLAEIVSAGAYEDTCLEALDGVNRTDFLDAIATKNQFVSVRIAAAERITDATHSRMLLNKVKDEGKLSQKQEKEVQDKINALYNSQVVNNTLSQSELVNLLEDCTDDTTQKDAARQIKDQGLLKKMVAETESPEILKEMVANLEDEATLCEMIQKEIPSDIKIVALEKVNNPELLQKIIQDATSDEIKIAAIENLHDLDVLMTLFKDETSAPVKCAIVENVTDQDVLLDIYQSEMDDDVKPAIINKIVDTEKLIRILETEMDLPLYDYAAERLLGGTQSTQPLPTKLYLDILTKSTKLPICQMAASKITDASLLIKIARDSSYSNVAREAAVAGVQDQGELAQVVKVEKEMDIVHIILNNMTDFATLSDIQQHAQQSATKNAAKARLSVVQESVLGNALATEKELVTAMLASNDTNISLQKDAIQKLKDQALLTQIVKMHTNLEVRKAALSKITEKAKLSDIMRSVKDVAIRQAANVQFQQQMKK